MKITHVAALGAALLLGVSAPVSAGNSSNGKHVPPQNTPRPPSNVPPPKTDVPAPPMLLLFGIGAAGVMWGRRLAAKANAGKS